MNAFFLFWNFERSGGLLDLIKICVSALGKCSSGFAVSIDHETFEAKTAEHILEEIKVRGANRVHFALRQTKHGLLAQRNVCECELRLSPQSQYWRGALSETDQDSQTATRNNEALAAWVHAARVQYPNVLSVATQLDSTDHEHWAHAAAEWIKDVLSQSQLEKAVRGFAEHHAAFASEFPQSMTRQPWTIDQLGERFDRLHSLMIASADEVESMAKALRAAGVRVDTKPVLAGSSRLTTAAIPSEFLKREDAIVAAKPFLVDVTVASTGFGAGPDIANAVAVGDVHRFPKRIFEQMLRERTVIPLPEGWTLHLVIDAKWCAMLGIDPEEMLVEAMQRSLSERIRAEVEERLRLQSKPITPEQVIGAHFEVYKKYFVVPKYREELERVIRLRYPIFGQFHSEGNT
jgi:hypothetical protein